MHKISKADSSREENDIDYVTLNVRNEFVYVRQFNVRFGFAEALNGNQENNQKSLD